MILRTHRGFPKQHQPTNLCNGEALSFLGKEVIFKYYLDELRASKS
jgi:hypothetical protein